MTYVMKLSSAWTFTWMKLLAPTWVLVGRGALVAAGPGVAVAAGAELVGATLVGAGLPESGTGWAPYRMGMKMGWPEKIRSGLVIPGLLLMSTDTSVP